MLTFQSEGILKQSEVDLFYFFCLFVSVTVPGSSAPPLTPHLNPEQPMPLEHLSGNQAHHVFLFHYDWEGRLHAYLRAYCTPPNPLPHLLLPKLSVPPPSLLPILFAHTP